MMKSKDGWRGHLRDLVSASLDPVVYAMQWAHDPRCLQRGSRHRRVGAYVASPAAGVQAVVYVALRLALSAVLR